MLGGRCGQWGTGLVYWAALSASDHDDSSFAFPASRLERAAKAA
jgi:hypothetical protein